MGEGMKNLLLFSSAFLGLRAESWVWAAAL
jgi:hypothetical protein